MTLEGATVIVLFILVMNFKEIHIGELIKKIVKEDQLDPYKICNYLEISETELTKIYHSKSLDSELLLKLSKVIKYDLFRVYSQHLLFYAPTNNNQHATRKIDSKIPVFRKSIYTKEIIDFVLELIENKTKTHTEITELYGIPKTTLHNWVKKYNK